MNRNHMGFAFGFNDSPNVRPWKAVVPVSEATTPWPWASKATSAAPPAP